MVSVEQKAKIRWQSRRGMLELDLVLSQFLDEWLERLTLSEIEALEQLLTYQDPDLYDLLMGYTQPTSKELAHIVESIRNRN